MNKYFFLILVFIIINPNLYSQNDVTFLFDNSGSMLGYYTDPASSFKIFSKALLKRTVSENDDTKIFLFNKTEQYRGIYSPELLFNGKGSSLIPDKIISSFFNKKASDGDFATTDIIEALDKAISGIRGGKGIIWLVTDNINDNVGTGDSSYINTLEFYNRLRTDRNVRKILLYPIPEKLFGKNYLSYGFVVYGIVYSYTVLSQQELEKYDEYFKSAGIKQKPLTLKPLDIGTIVLFPRKSQGKISPGKLYFDGKTLKGFGFEESTPVKEVFPDIVLKSNLFPYIIKSARLNVKLENFVSSDYSVKSLGTQSISPSTVSNVSPEGEVTGFSVIFNMPEITPNFSFSTVFTEDFYVGGNLILEVSNVDIILDEKYMENFKEVFALKTIPEIFQPVLKDKRIQSKIPLEIRINYGPWRMFLLVALIILLLIVLVTIFYMLSIKYGFIINYNDSEEQLIYISVLNPYNVYFGNSPQLGKLKKEIFGNLKFIFSKETSFPNKVVNVKEGIPLEIKYGELFRDSVTLTITAKNKNSEGEIYNDSSKFY